MLLAKGAEFLCVLLKPSLRCEAFQVVGGGLIGLSLFRTAAARKAEHLYVSVWYILGSFVWFPMLYLTAKIYPWSGAAC